MVQCGQKINYTQATALCFSNREKYNVSVSNSSTSVSLPERTGHASLPGPTAPLVTAFAAAGPGLWNSYCHISEMLTYRAVGSGGH